jgi:hypothetical protein
MVRTTLNLDPTVLDELRERAACEGLSLGALASRLLATELKKPPPLKPSKLKWHAQAMGKPRIDVDDREALLEFLDREILDR